MNEGSRAEAASSLVVSSHPECSALPCGSEQFPSVLCTQCNASPKDPRLLPSPAAYSPLCLGLSSSMQSKGPALPGGFRETLCQHLLGLLYWKVMQEEKPDGLGSASRCMNLSQISPVLWTSHWTYPRGIMKAERTLVPVSTPLCALCSSESHPPYSTMRVFSLVHLKGGEAS